MEILLDEKTMEIEKSDAHNLEEILLKVMSEHVSTGNVITTVKLNGEVYSEKAPHDAAGVKFGDIRSLEISTMTGEEIAGQFLENAGDQLDVMVQAAEKISGLFRLADEKEANEQYAVFLETLGIFMKMLGEVRGMLDATAEEKLGRLTGTMDKMIHIQEQGDWMMLADLLEYELAPVLREWREIFSDLPTTG